MESKLCRICFCGEEDGAFLTDVCNCVGARSLVHEACLKRWQRTARSKGQWEAGRRCHACNSDYLVRFDDEKIAIGILGGTGLVGRQLAATLARGHSLFCLGPVVGSEASVGKSLKEVWENKEKALEMHYGKSIWEAHQFPNDINLDSVIVAPVSALGACDYVISAIAPDLGHFEENLRNKGILVFSISPYARNLIENPLIVPEANGLAALEKIYQNESPKKMLSKLSPPLFKSPNCVVCGISLPLAAIDTIFKLKSISVTTFQALSGRGDAKYFPASLVVKNIFPLAKTKENTDEYQRAEIMRLFPQLESCSVSSHRVPVQNGHFVRIGCVFKNSKPTNIDHVKDIFSAFQPFKHLNLPSAPENPIIVVDQPGRPNPNLDSNYDHGMTVAVGQLGIGDAHDLFDLSFSLVVNNLVRGAYGGALLNAELFELYGRRRSPVLGSECLVLQTTTTDLKIQ